MKTLILVVILICLQQKEAIAQTDTLQALQKSGVDTPPVDTAYQNMIPPAKKYQQTLSDLVKANQFIDLTVKPELAISKEKENYSKEYLFYLICGTLLLFGLFKLFYAGYFRNVLQVFFNSSLRQNHLTDILLQAKLPSLIFNAFFIFISGLYAWLLLTRYNAAADFYDRNKMLVFCITAIGVIYTAKYCVLKFIGWLTGMLPVSNIYIFVTFLINKIIGIILMPFIVLIAFAPGVFFNITVTLSLLILATLFIIRFFRSYSILQHQIQFTRMHFLLYIFSVEILPLILIYKISLRFL